MNAEILCVGTELLMGEVVNTDAAFLGEKLANLGIDVFHHSVVGDNKTRLSEIFCEALGRSDIIIISGGLGPTPDDLTKEVVTECLGFDLVLHEESLLRMREYFENINKPMGQINVKQAMMPKGQIVLPNNHGTAPGAILQKDGKIVILLPGPPTELMYMFCESVEPFLKNITKDKFFSKMYHIFGIGESKVAELLKDFMEKSSNPTVAPYAKTGEVYLRLCAKAENEEEAEALMKDIESVIYEKVGDFIYSKNGDTLPCTAVKLLEKKGLSISAAESCTGGMLAKMITDIPGASSILNESYVTYANAAKMRILDVKENTLDTLGAVSDQTAYEMAVGVKKVSGADIGVGITGIAGPDGGTEEKPVGLVYFAVAYKDNVRIKKLLLNGDREKVRYLTCLNVFDEIRQICITEF